MQNIYNYIKKKFYLNNKKIKYLKLKIWDKIKNNLLKQNKIKYKIKK